MRFEQSFYDGGLVLTLDRRRVKEDLAIILGCSFVFAALYVGLGETVMSYCKNDDSFIAVRFLPVLAIQFGMSCLGVAIVMVRNKERISQYGLARKNLIQSVVGCLLLAVPTLACRFYFRGIQTLLPFQGMFLTEDILASPFPLSFMLYLVVALVWGFGEGFYYVCLSTKINLLFPSKGVLNLGAAVCAIFAVLIHGMIGFDLETVIEAVATFILMYGTVVLKDRLGNSWGNILIFFVIWNAV